MRLLKVQVLVSSHGVAAGGQHTRGTATAQRVTWHQLFQQSLQSLLKALPTQSFATCTHDWRTHRDCSSLSSLNFELLSVNLYYISTSDYNHGPLTFVRTHKTHRTRCTIKSWISRCSFIPPCVTWTAGAASAHTSQGQYEQSLHFIHKFSGKENCAFCLFFFFFLNDWLILLWLFLKSHDQGILRSGMRVSFAKTTSAYSWV